MTITSDQIQPLLDDITSNVPALLPACIIVLAILFGVEMIPRIMSRFL